MRKKAQSAIEFLVTYGWAFFMVFGFIGVLFYLDVLDVSRMLPDKCEFSSEIECQEKIIREESVPEMEDGKVFVKLVNNLGATMVIDDCYLDIAEMLEDDDLFCQDTKGSCGSGEFNLKGIEWPQGESLVFNFSQCTTHDYGLSAGNKQEVFMTVQYHALGSSPDYLHNITGRIFTRIEEQ